MHIANTDVTFCDGLRIKTIKLDAKAKVEMGGGGGGLNRFYVEKILALGSAGVKKTDKLFGPREGLLIHLCIKTANI